MRFGYSVSDVVNSGEKALKSVARVVPDLVVMDIRIKGAMDGIETAQRLKELHKVSVLYLTAYGDQQNVERAKRTEPLGYIHKPFTPVELRAAVEIALHKSEMEKKIREWQTDLESKVKRRTQSLLNEIESRKIIEEELRNKSDYLDKANKALKTMLENREAEKRAVEEEIFFNIKRYIFPYIELIERQQPGEEILRTLYILQEALNALITPATKTLFSKYIDLTPQEAKVADLIRYGKKTKEIATLLHIAPSSVSTYRNNIRKKMGLLNSGSNLETYLKSFQ